MSCNPKKVRYLKAPAYHPTMAVYPVEGGYRVLNHLLRVVVVTDLDEADFQSPGDLDPWAIPGSCWMHIGTADTAEPRLFQLYRTFEDEVHAYAFDWEACAWTGPPGIVVDLKKADYSEGGTRPFSMTPLTKARFLKDHVRLWAPDNMLDGPRHPNEGSLYMTHVVDRQPNTQYISRHQARRTIYDMLLE